MKLLTVMHVLMHVFRAVSEGLNDTCATSIDCSTRVLHSDCIVDGGPPVCSCVTGYKEKSGSCDAYALGESCSNTVDCSTAVTRSECKDNNAGSKTCECTVGYMDVDGKCEAYSLGDPCLHSSDCNTTINHSECKSNGSVSTCSCRLGFKESDGGCSEYALGDTCTEAQQCNASISHTECKANGETRTCECWTGYRNSSGKCVSYTIEESCESSSTDCETAVSNSRCTEVSSGVFKCKCIDGFYGDTGDSACNEIPCSLPPSLLHASVSVNSNGAGFIATYACHSGYDMPDAEMNRKSCHSGSTSWSDNKVECLIKGFCQDDPPAVNNASPTLSDDGNTATYICNLGYEIIDVNITSSFCNQTMNIWTSTTDLCKVKDCLSPESLRPNHGIITLDEKEVTTYGATATVSCKEGYYWLEGSQKITCQNSKLWTQPLSTCQIKDCGTVPDLLNGKVELDDDGTTTFESNATLTCNEGYESNSYQTKIKCLATGYWENITRICTAKDCTDSLPQPVGGNTTLDEPNATSYLATATQRCNEGYTSSESEPKINCLSSGEWENVTIKCTIIDCGTEPELINGTVKLDDDGVTTYNSTATLICNEGYGSNSSQTKIKCLATGDWEDITRICELKDCGIPKLPAHGDMTLSNNNTKYGAVAVQTCHLGYDILGSTNIECLASGEWSAAAATCTPKDCGRLYAPINGKVNGLTSTASSSYGAMANFTCKSGYRLAGIGERVCKSNGKWSGNSDPNCLMQEPATCGNADVIPYSDYEYNDAATVATYTCHGGYEFENANISKLKCSESEMKWDGTAPFCKLKENHKKLSVTMVFDTESDIDLSDEKVKLDYIVKTEVLVQERIRTKINNSDIYVKVLSLRWGSLIAETDFVVADTTYVLSKFLEAIVYLLQSNKPIDIDGISGNVLCIQLENEIYTSDNADAFHCAAFITLRGSCATGYECVVTNGIAECRAEKLKNNSGVIIGVGVGVPVGLLTVVLVVVLILYIKRKSAHQKSYTHRGSSQGAYHHHSPSKFVIRSTSDYGKSYGYFGQQKAENDYGSQHLPHSRPGSGEHSGDSKLSWDFMYHGNLYPPGTKFEIKRPQIRA